VYVFVVVDLRIEYQLIRHVLETRHFSHSVDALLTRHSKEEVLARK